LSLHLQHQPFLHPDHNRIESMGLHACLLQLLTALLCNSVGKVGKMNTLGPNSTAILGIVMFGSTVIFFGWTLRVTIQNSHKTEGAVGMLSRRLSSKKNVVHSSTTKVRPVENKNKVPKESASKGTSLSIRNWNRDEGT
jgi:hypothetical protein